MEGRSYTVCKSCSAFNAPGLTACHRCEAPLTHTQRKFERTVVALIALVLESDGGTHEVEVTNLGLGGLLFRSDRPYVEEDILRLRIPIENETFSVEAEVRHCQEDFRGYYVGVEFSMTSPPFIFKVHQLLKASGVA